MTNAEDKTIRLVALLRKIERPVTRGQESPRSDHTWDQDKPDWRQDTHTSPTRPPIPEGQGFILDEKTQLKQPCTY
jgi:hypothetical protein